MSSTAHPLDCAIHELSRCTKEDRDPGHLMVAFWRVPSPYACHCDMHATGLVSPCSSFPFPTHRAVPPKGCCGNSGTCAERCASKVPGRSRASAPKTAVEEEGGVPACRHASSRGGSDREQVQRVRRRQLGTQDACTQCTENVAVDWRGRRSEYLGHAYPSMETSLIS